jgi:hypothetical protein
MYNKLDQKYKDTVELKLKWTTKIYYNKKEDLSIRFDNGYFLFLEQRIKENELSYKDKILKEPIKKFDRNY